MSFSNNYCYYTIASLSFRQAPFAYFFQNGLFFAFLGKWEEIMPKSGFLFRCMRRPPLKQISRKKLRDAFIKKERYE